MDKLAEYRVYLLRRGLREQTIKDDIECIERVRRHTPLTKEGVYEFLLGLREQGRRFSTLNRIISVLHTYAEFAGIAELKEITYFKTEPFAKATMSDSEIEAFLALPRPLHGVSKIDWEKWWCFWAICAYTGMRMSEVATLTIEQVDLGRNLFILEHTKTNVPRNIPIPAPVKKRLCTYLDCLCSEKLFPSSRNGCSRSNGVLDGADWGYSFHSRCKRLGIKRKNLTPYSLRHSYASRMLNSEEHVNVFQVQRLMGHKNLTTTLQYYHLDETQLQKTAKKDPLAREYLSPLEQLKIVKEEVETIRKLLTGVICEVEEADDHIAFRVSIKQ